MDPITQGALGAAVAHLLFAKRLPRAAALVGAAAAMSPDLDVLIPTFGDPTAGWVWHRGPTHSLAAIPIGGVLAGLVFLLFKPLRREWRTVLGAAVVGYATHAPLDALTSYGTQLLWPFSNSRAALDWMPIIDPVYTLALLVGMTIGVWKKRALPTAIGLAVSFAYIGFAGVQHGRAVREVERIAEAAGRDPSLVRATPSPLAPVLWHGFYLSDGRIYSVGVRTGWIGPITVNDRGENRRLATMDVARTPEAMRHFDHFSWFADGTLFVEDESQPERVGDGRYTSDAAGFGTLWGLDFSTDPPTRFSNFSRNVDPTLAAMLGRDPAYQRPN